MNGAAGRALPSVVWGVIALAVLLCVWLLLRSGRQGAEAVIMHPFAPSHPRVYADNAAASSVGPQARAELIDRADRALAREPRIPLGGETTAAGRLYRTDPPYAGWTRVDGRSPDYRDGRINPAADRRDYEAATAAGREARDLGLAGVLTGERRYLSGSRDRLRAWCLDPATAMAPRFTTPQSRIEICVTVPAMILAADLLWDLPVWDEGERERLAVWFADLARDARGWSRDNNQEAWRAHLMTAAGALVGDAGIYADGIRAHRAALDAQIDDDGVLVREQRRSDARGYTRLALQAFTLTEAVRRRAGAEDAAALEAGPAKARLTAALGLCARNEIAAAEAGAAAGEDSGDGTEAGDTGFLVLAGVLWPEAVPPPPGDPGNAWSDRVLGPVAFHTQCAPVRNHAATSKGDPR